MKKASEKAALILVSVVALVVVAFVVASTASDRRRTAALEQVRKPAAMEAYARYRGSDSPEHLEAEDRAVDMGAREGRGGKTARSGNPDETIAGYQRLFEELDRRTESFPDWGEAAKWRGKLDELSPEEQARFLEFLEENRDLLDDIRQMARAGGPVCPLDFSQGYGLELPHLAKMREFARLVCRDAVVQAYAGNLDLAVEDLVAGMQLGDALAGEPVLISQLVRISIYNVVSDALTDAFQPGELSPQQIDILVDQMARADNRQAFADSLSGENVMGLREFDRVRDGELPGYLGQGIAGQSLGDTQQLFFRLYSSPIARPWFNNDEATYAEFMGRMAEAAELPYQESQPIFDQLEQDIEDLPATRVISQVLLPALARANQAQARHEANLDLMQMGLFLEQYYVDHGEYPESLEAITPSLGGALPVDPFSGESYVYQPSANSFLLYGLGMNRTDEGGVHDTPNGDVVWRGREAGD